MKKSEIKSDPTEQNSPTEGGKKSAVASDLGQNAYSSVDWINLLIEENEDNYKEKAPDQIVLDFMKRRKDFPLLNEWNSYFLREYFRKMKPGIAPAYLGLVNFTAQSKAKPQEYLWTFSLTVEALYCAMTMLNPLRMRIEQYLKNFTNRSPGFLGDFYRKSDYRSQAVEEATAPQFVPQIKDFWEESDLAAMQKIRDDLAAGWSNTRFKYKDSDLSDWLNFCLTIRMQSIEFQARMIYSSGPQWIEILKLFLRRTLPMDDPAFLLFGNGIPDNDTTANFAAQKLLKFADQFYESPLPRLPNNWLNYGMRGLNIPQYPKLDKLKEQEEKIS